MRKFSLRRRKEVFKSPREKKRAQMVAQRLLGQAPILETYASATANQAQNEPKKVVQLVRPGEDASTAVPWFWEDSSFRELWVQIDGFTVEKRLKGENPQMTNEVFVEEDEELPVYTRDEQSTSSFGCEKHGYLAITVPGFGVVAAVALYTATRLHSTRHRRFKFWYEQLEEFGVGDAATVDMLRGKTWLVRLCLQRKSTAVVEHSKGYKPVHDMVQFVH